MLLCGILLLYSHFSMSLSQFQPILVSLVTLSAVLCRCFKATSLGGILPLHGLCKQPTGLSPTSRNL